MYWVFFFNSHSLFSPPFPAAVPNILVGLFLYRGPRTFVPTRLTDPSIHYVTRKVCWYGPINHKFSPLNVFYRLSFFVFLALFICLRLSFPLQLSQYSDSTIPSSPVVHHIKCISWSTMTSLGNVSSVLEKVILLSPCPLSQCSFFLLTPIIDFSTPSMVIEPRLPSSTQYFLSSWLSWWQQLRSLV